MSEPVSELVAKPEIAVGLVEEAMGEGKWEVLSQRKEWLSCCAIPEERVGVLLCYPRGKGGCPAVL